MQAQLFLCASFDWVYGLHSSESSHMPTRMLNAPDMGLSNSLNTLIRLILFKYVSYPREKGFVMGLFGGRKKTSISTFDLLHVLLERND